MLIRLKIYIILILSVIVLALLFQKRSNELHISPLNSKYLYFHPIGGLKYFYEPLPNSKQDIPQKLLLALGYKNGTKISYTINQDGLNQAKNYKTEKENATRIIAIGDSFTFGEKVNTLDNYPSQLEGMLNDMCRANNTRYQWELGVMIFSTQ